MVALVGLNLVSLPPPEYPGSLSVPQVAKPDRSHIENDRPERRNCANKKTIHHP